MPGKIKFDDKQGQQVVQNTTTNYLYRPDLQALLESLFPNQTDFKIQQREDQWYFTAPRMLETAEIDEIRRTD